MRSTAGTPFRLGACGCQAFVNANARLRLSGSQAAALWWKDECQERRISGRCGVLIRWYPSVGYDLQDDGLANIGSANSFPVVGNSSHLKAFGIHVTDADKIRSICGPWVNCQSREDEY